jgi:hypothetical protein
MYLGVETRGDECSPVGNEIGTFPKRETLIMIIRGNIVRGAGNSIR